MEITSAERNKKNKDRMSIYIDGRFAFTISEEDYLSMNLYEKKEITDEELDYIKNTLNFRTAKAAAVRYLSLKLRTEKEVRRKLHEDGYDDQNTENVISELKAIGYINNKLYAQKYVFDRSKLKPKSKKLLKLELQSRGISPEIADEVLEDWKVDEAVVAEELVRRKFGKYNLSDEGVREKVYMFLNHRGYNRELVEEVLNKLKDDRD
jgi:regulatory protein